MHLQLSAVLKVSVKRLKVFSNASQTDQINDTRCLLSLSVRVFTVRLPFLSIYLMLGDSQAGVRIALALQNSLSDLWKRWSENSLSTSKF